MAGDLLDRIIGEIRERKREARSACEESQQLERALAALDAEASGGATGRRSKGARPARRGAKQPAGGRACRGANREAILAAVRERPGLTARGIADVTGIARTTVAVSAEDGSEIFKRVVPILFGRALQNPYHGFTVYTVQPGDTLSSIAQEFYGDPERLRTIFQANRNVLEDPDAIFPGQELRIPQ